MKLKITEGFESKDIVVGVNTKQLFQQLFLQQPASNLETIKLYDKAEAVFEYTESDKKHLPEFKTSQDLQTDMINLSQKVYEPITLTAPIVEAMLGFLDKINIQGHVVMACSVFSILEEEGVVEFETDLLDLETETLEDVEFDTKDLLTILNAISKVLIPDVKTSGTYKPVEFLQSAYISKVVKDVFESKDLETLAKLKALFESKYDADNFETTLEEYRAIKKYFKIEL